MLDDRDRDNYDHDPELCDGVTLFSHITDELPYGRQLDMIDQLSQMDRMLYQEQDFFFAGTKVFKKIDPITQAMDGDWGQDISTADPEVVAEWEAKLAAEVDPHYDDAMNYIVEQSIDDCHVYADVVDETECLKVISIDFLNLSGHHVALGYSPPRDKYKFCGNFAPNLSQKIAKERKEACSWIISDIKNTDNLKELNQIIVSIREDYTHDKQLRSKWSEQSRIKARLATELEMRANPKTNDEETIRQKLWSAYNKVPGKFITANGRHMKSYGSKWHRTKSRAMRELKFNYQQWQDIYGEIDNRKQYFLVDRSELLYKSIEKRINSTHTSAELQKVHELMTDSVHNMNKDHRQRIWKLYGIKAKQRGLYGERRYNGLGTLS
jgi:hypothetical protein